MVVFDCGEKQMEPETIKGPSRAELSRALRLAHEQLSQLWQMFHSLVADESDARMKKHLAELARQNKND